MTDIVRIGNPRGKIALFLDAQQAVDMADHYGRGDAAFTELWDAIEKAYPDFVAELDARIREERAG